MKANALVSHLHLGQASLLLTYPPTKDLRPRAITGLWFFISGRVKCMWVLEESWAEYHNHCICAGSQRWMGESSLSWRRNPQVAKKNKIISRKDFSGHFFFIPLSSFKSTSMTCKQRNFWIHLNSIVGKEMTGLRGWIWVENQCWLVEQSGGRAGVG